MSDSDDLRHIARLTADPTLAVRLTEIASRIESLEADNIELRSILSLPPKVTP